MSAGRFTARSPLFARRPSGLELDLITRLRNLPVGPRPDARFKSDLRSQLVAITARVVAESATDVTAGAKTASIEKTRSRRTFGSIVFGHPAMALASFATSVVVVLVAATMLSSNALPGDALYRVKRTSESVQLSLASGNIEKGRVYLNLAATRADEARKLLNKTGAARPGAAVVSSRTTSLVTDTLGDADASSRSGMQLLAKAAVIKVSTDPLKEIDAWIGGQRATLTEVKSLSPAGALRERARQSLSVLDRIAARKSALASNIACPCLSSAVSDDLGPVPCSPCKPLTAPKPSPGVTNSPGLPVPGSLPPAQPSGSSPLPRSSQPPRSSSSSAGETPSTAPSQSGGGPLPSVLPSLPLPTDGLPLPSLTVTAIPGVSAGVGSGGISVSASGLPAITLPGLISLN